MAAGDPPQRAPTMMASYWLVICHPSHESAVPAVRMTGAAPAGIGEVPYLRPYLPLLVLGAGGVGGRLGPAPEPELGQDVADVVLHGLAADVEAVGDLRVRETMAEEGEH